MRPALIALLLLLPGGHLLAQVGTPPSKSPYRDIIYDANFSLMAGYFAGDGGSLGIGAHDGWLYGFRFQMKANHFIAFGIGASYGWDLQRNIIDPFAPAGSRIKGPVPVHTFLPEAVLQFNLTANKSWHRVAPYFGIAGGGAWSSTSVPDTVYTNSWRFVFTPFVGTRLFVTQKLAVRLEARMPVYKISYPATYLNPQYAIVNTSGEWVASGWFIAGLVYNFSLKK